jgi:hypothetical protein
VALTRSHIFVSAGGAHAVGEDVIGASLFGVPLAFDATIRSSHTFGDILTDEHGYRRRVI